jgi:hypothetical protein
MKKYIFTVVALFLGVCQMSAQTIVFEPVVEVPLNGKAQVAVKYETGGLRITTYSLNFDLSEAEGLSLTQKDGGVDFVTDSKNSAFNVSATATGIGATAKNTSVSLDGTTGTLGTVTFEATAPLKVNDEVTVKVNKLSLVEYTEDERLVTIELPETSFTVKIVENRITLDETVGVTDETPTGTQNVLVKRTIKAGNGNNWSTICLPFAMDAEQMKTAFGEGVELADFDSYEETYDAAKENVIAIDVKFTAATTFEANHPYIVKVGADITEIKLDGVMLEPSEEDAYVEYDNGKTGRQRVVFGTFVGTYTAETLVPADDLFLSGNKFYYSTGSTKMKAFRGFFELSDVLAVKASGAKINISVDGEATSIDGIGTQHVVEGVYDLSGRKIQLQDGDLNKLQKGVYIIDGKKVTIK